MRDKISNKNSIRKSIKEVRNLKVRYLYILLLVASFLLTISIAYAHKVSLFAYSEGGKIYTESYFPDGSPVKEGIIKVYDSTGKLILKGKTDKDGLFDFKIPVNDDLKIILEASMGHRAEFILSKDELVPAISGTKRTKGTNTKSTEKNEAGESEQSIARNITGESVGSEGGIKTADAEYIRQIIREELTEELKPISRGIAKIQEEKKPGPSEVIGGIGYILGIVGISMYFISRKNEKKNGNKNDEGKQS